MLLWWMPVGRDILRILIFSICCIFMSRKNRGHAPRISMLCLLCSYSACRKSPVDDIHPIHQHACTESPRCLLWFMRSFRYLQFTTMQCFDILWKKCYYFPRRKKWKNQCGIMSSMPTHARPSGIPNDWWSSTHWETGRRRSQSYPRRHISINPTSASISIF